MCTSVKYARCQSNCLCSRVKCCWYEGKQKGEACAASYNSSVGPLYEKLPLGQAVFGM